MIVTMLLLMKIFGIGFVLNFIWECSHCWLYETCRRQSWRHNLPLLIKMSLKDSFLIVTFYLISASTFNVANILHQPAAVGEFVALAGLFSFLDEKISLYLKRWEYADAMPIILGVGVTPLFEIAVTGLVTIFIAFSFLS